MTLSEEDKKRIEAEETFRAETRVKAEAAALKEKKSKEARQGCLGFLIVAGIVFLFVALTPKETPEQKAKNEAEQEKKKCEDSAWALTMAEKFVTKRLKAPATASFPWSTEAKIKYLGDCTHEIFSYVDSENSFGAKIRNNYMVQLKYVGKGKWEELKMVIE